jgi:hypothetical protein
MSKMINRELYIKIMIYKEIELSGETLEQLKFDNNKSNNSS